MTLEELIERIGYIRNRANLSARKLSLAIGKNAGYIHMLETNRNFAPTFETLLEILDACNTDTEEFFYYSIPAYRHDKEIIEKAKLHIEQWLEQIGLKLNEKKTKIVHTLKPFGENGIGFNFLGFHVRQYYNRSTKRGYVTMIKPTKEGQKRHRQIISEKISRLKSETQEVVIKVLNPIVRGWANYYKHQVSRKAFENADNFIASLKSSHIPDIVLMSMDLNGINGIEATKLIKKEFPKVKVIILSSNKDKEYFIASMYEGANAFVQKSIDHEQLMKIIKAVHFGAYWIGPDHINLYKEAFPKPDSYDLQNLYKKQASSFDLTVREKQVLKLLVEGKSNSEIAKEIIISTNTAKAHVGNILNKMHVTDRVQAAVIAVKSNII